MHPFENLQSLQNISSKELARRTHELTKLVAARLGTPWTCAPHDEESFQGTIFGNNRAKLYLNTTHKRGRLAIYACLPSEELRAAEASSTALRGIEITVALDAPVARIASNIQQRILPKYMPLLDEVESRIQEGRAYLEKRESARHKLLSVQGVSAVRHSDTELHSSSPGVYRVQLRSANRVRLELDVSTDLAVAILQLVPLREAEE
jgi:hypothetical protein